MAIENKQEILKVLNAGLADCRRIFDVVQRSLKSKNEQKQENAMILAGQLLVTINKYLSKTGIYEKKDNPGEDKNSPPEGKV